MCSTAPSAPTPRPFWEAIKEFPTSCGEVGWERGRQHRDDCSRALPSRSNWPVLYPYVSPKQTFDKGRLSDKVPAIMGDCGAMATNSSPRSRPREKDILVPKKHPSAFFGTPLASYLINAGADTLVVTGCTTSGCVRGTVVDGFAYNFRVAVPEDAVFDRQRSIACRQSVRHGGEICRCHADRRRARSSCARSAVRLKRQAVK